LDTENLRQNYTENNYTNINNLILSNSEDEIDKKTSYEDIFKQNIEYDILVADVGNAELIEDITNIAIDTLGSKKDYVYINSEPKPTNLVKSQLLKLKSRTYSICYKLLKKQYKRN